MSAAAPFCGGPKATSIAKPHWSLARVLPVLAACMPKLGCPLCWPALAALCSLCGVPFATLSPLLIGASVLAIALLLISAALRRGFGWASGLLLAGLCVNLGARLWAVPVWVVYVATALVLTGLVAEFFRPGRLAAITPAAHCIAIAVPRRSREEG
jgi:hypothetical protein